MLRDENERRNTAGGREISFRSVEGNGGRTGGKQSRQRGKEYATTFAFCARDASRGRDAPINRRRDVGRRTRTYPRPHTGTRTVSLSLSVLPFPSVFLHPIYPFSPPADPSTLRTRGWNY